MKPCPCCGIGPIVDGFIHGIKGYIVCVDLTCGYKTIPKKTMEEAEEEWEDVTSQVAQWMIDKKLIKYGMDRFIEDEANLTQKSL